MKSKSKKQGAKVTLKIEGYGKPCVFNIMPQLLALKPQPLPQNIIVSLSIASLCDDSLVGGWQHIFTKKEAK